MAPPPLRPENALKRAEELISVGESQAALQSLFDFFTARRIRFAEPSSVEPIVFRFLELGVDLKKGRMIKDALHQYKKLVQGSPEGLASVSAISRKFIDIVEKKIAVEQAKEGEKVEEDEDDDLESQITPENLLLSAYEEDQTVAGFNDEALTSWMRFTWESYRAVLDLLRNNSQLEITYSGVVNRTMMFCLKNNRKNEFKRLADMLRQHLDAANYQQSKNGTNIVDLSDNDTLQRYLEQRFQLVHYSVKLELWHEAFRSIEDVFHLMKISSHAPKSSTLANYYQNMAKVFLVSGDSLLHTIAWKKFYDLFLTNPNASQDDFKTYASTIFLSVLASKLDELPTVGYDRQFRLYRLLGLDGKPNRGSIMTQLLQEDFYQYVDEDIKSLYVAMETEFSAEDIKGKLATLLPKLSTKPYFAQYVDSLKDIIVRRSIVEASTKNETITMTDLVKLVTLPEPFVMNAWDVERALLEAAVEDYVSFTIDHETDTVVFVKDPFTTFVQMTEAAAAEAAAEEEDDEEEIPEDLDVEEEVVEVAEDKEKEEGEGEEEEVAEPEVIVTRNFYIRNRLSELSKTLNEVENFAALPYFQKIKLARESLIERNQESIEKAKAAAEERTKRHQEARRKYQEENALHAEADAEVRQKRNLEEKALMEAKLAEDARQRLIEKKKRELATLKESITSKAIADVNAKGNVYIDPALAKTMDLKDLRTLIVSQLSKDQLELQEKVDYARNRLDYTERALRKVELPILQKEAEEHKAVDMKKYEAMNAKIIESAKTEHEARLEDHTRLTQVYGDYESLRNKLYESHEAEFGEQRKQLQAKLAEAKEKRIAEVRQQRYDELVAKRKSEIASAERAERNKKEEELMRKRREMEEAANAKRIQAQPSVSSSAPRSSPFGSMNDAKRDEIARRQREMEAALEQKQSQPKASPFGSMNDAKRDEIARRQREMEAALEQKQSQPKASPFGSMNDAKRDEIARKQREMEAALEAKSSANKAPEPKKGAYVPPSRRNRK